MEEEGFDIVVGMMCHTNVDLPLRICRTQALRHLGKPPVPQAACGHLDALAVCAGLMFRIEIRNLKGNVVTLTETADKILVALALLTPQVEVAVQGMYSESQPTEDEDHRYRVGTSTESAKHQALPDNDAMLYEEGLYGIQCWMKG